MAYIIKNFGAPGTGKTTRTIEILGELISKGKVRENSIYATSLTRATKTAFIRATERWGIPINNEQVRTIHSFCYNLLKEKRKQAPTVVTAKEIKEFFLNKGFEFKEDEISYNEDEEFVTSDYSDSLGNKLFQSFNKIRLNLDESVLKVSTKEYIQSFWEKEKEEIPVSLGTYYNLLMDYIKWLRKNDIYDFTRLLTAAVVERVKLSGDVLVLDEFQDIGNLHAYLIKRWIPNFKYVIVSGDDDQAIFEFAGSNPTHIIKLEANETHILQKSYRLPKEILNYAQSIINRNSYRVLKDLKPRGDGGSIEMAYFPEDILDYLDSDKTSLILARNRCFVDEWRRLLEKNDIPYKYIGTNRKLPSIFKVLWIYTRVLNNKPVSGVEFLELVDALKPLIKRLTGKKQIRDNVIKELIQKIKRKDYSGTIGKIVYMFYSKNLPALFPNESKAMLDKWMRRVKNYEAWLSPKIELGTIHSAKGLEADYVFLDTRITRKVEDTIFRNPEAERRVLYVGITRAREKLCLISSVKRRSYERAGFI